MKKLTIEDILKPGAALKALKLNGKDPEIARMISDTINEQEAILKLKEVSQESLELRITI